MESEGSVVESSAVTDGTQAEESFILTTEGGDEPVLVHDDAAEKSNEDLPEEVLQVPKYSTVFTGFLTTPEFDMDSGKHITNDVKPKRTCFNCLGDHNVQDCPEIRDQRKIAENRRTHMANRPPASVRYHELFSSKYSNFTPGQLSPELRHALGCQSHQQPETVYRMRLLGYPPGWLMEAREQTGELALFGGDGRAVCQPGGEDGEVAGGAKYRSEKLIEFPGFNCRLPEGVKEESRWYNLPSMQPQHSLKGWREVMDRNRATPYRKRKMRAENTGVIDAAPPAAPALDDTTPGSDDECIVVNSTSVRTVPQRDANGSDNEVLEEGEVSSDAEMTPCQHNLKRKHEDENGESSQTGARKKAKSHSSTIELSDGDSTQGTLTLDDTAATEPIVDLSFIDTNPSPVAEVEAAEPNCDSDDDGLDNKSKDKKSSDETNGVAASSSQSGRSTPIDTDNPGTPNTTSTPAPGKRLKNHRRAGSKGFVLGAVIPESISGFKELPDFDKWTVDVTDHILFENLPDALGTWKNMRGLMQKVRSKMAEVHTEDD